MKIIVRAATGGVACGSADMVDDATDDAMPDMVIDEKAEDMVYLDLFHMFAGIKANGKKAEQTFSGNWQLRQI